MKKFLALLFVCAGLTAMAAPQVNKADLKTVNKGEMVMKANTLANNLTSGVVNKNFMEAAKKNVQMNHATNCRSVLCWLWRFLVSRCKRWPVLCRFLLG